MSWIWTILAGAVVGLLGRLIAPDNRDNVSLGITVVIGIVGVVIGRFLARAIGVEHTSGGDWIKWAIQIGLAVVLVMATSVWLAKRRKTTPPA